MSSSLDHFGSCFVRAFAKQKANQHVQTKQQVQKIDSSNVINTITKTTTAKLSDEQYRTSIIAKAIAYIKQKGSM